MISQTDRIIINTIAQYARIVLVIILMLYSTRIVLKELGGDGFGLYSLIASALAFLSFLNTALTRTTQRFLSYYMGKGDMDQQSEVVVNAFFLNFAISAVTILIMVIVEPFLFNGFLRIGIDQTDIAKTLYRLMVVCVFFTMNIAPFNAIFVSHENIVFSSVAYVLVAILRLTAAFLLSLYAPKDKLIAYGIFMCIISIIEFLLFAVTAWVKYKETRSFCKLSLLNRSLLVEILSFSGWNLYNVICVIGREQGYAVVINRFVSLTANAGYGIANQVSGQINNFVYTVSHAVSPVIMKSAGANDREKMISYSVSSSKISALLLSMIAIPFIFEIKGILELWLGSVPAYAESFITIILMASMADCLSSGFKTGIQAMGRMRSFSLFSYTLKISSIPVSVILLYQGVHIEMALIPYVILELFSSIIVMSIFCRGTGVIFSKMIIKLLKQTFPAFFVAIAINIVICNVMEASLMRIFTSFIATVTLLLFTTYFTSLDSYERILVKSLINRIIHKHKILND